MQFKTYEDFCEWVYEIKDEQTQTIPRLKVQEEIHLDTEPYIYYTSVMDCLHAHEEA